MIEDYTTKDCTTGRNNPLNPTEGPPKGGKKPKNQEENGKKRPPEAQKETIFDTGRHSQNRGVASHIHVPQDVFSDPSPSKRHTFYKFAPCFVVNISWNTNSEVYICIMFNKKIFVLEKLGEIYVYGSLSRLCREHIVGKSIHSLYRFPFEDRKFENDVCKISKQRVL